jgi:hypothetical protein
MTWERLGLRTALIFAHGAVLILVIASMVEVFKTIAGIIRDLERNNEILLVGALLVALVPSGAMLFWGCYAIAIWLDLPIRRVCRHCRNQINRKSLAQGRVQAGDQGEI